MSCLQGGYCIPAGIRFCCAVSPASQCSLSIRLLRYGETNAKSALSVDVYVSDPSGSCGSGQASPVPRERTDSLSFACRAYLTKNKPAGAYASTGCLYDLSGASEKLVKTPWRCSRAMLTPSPACRGGRGACWRVPWYGLRCRRSMRRGGLRIRFPRRRTWTARWPSLGRS